MRGHLVKRGANSWTAVIYVGRDSTTGKKQYKWQAIKGTKKHADQELASIINHFEQGTYVTPNKVTVGVFLEKWLKDYAKTNTAPRTYERYAQIVKLHLIPNLGSVGLSKLSPEQLQGYYASELTNGRSNGKGGLSAQTVLHHHRVLSEALNHAVKWGLVVRNVALAVDPPRAIRKEMIVADTEDIRPLLDQAKLMENSSAIPYYTLFYTALHTGMRRGEILALRWSDIDLEMATISINRSLQRLSDGTTIIREPKTPKARRNIPMTPSLAIQLRNYRSSQKTIMALDGKIIQKDDLMFCNLEGNPLNPNTITPAFHKIAKRAGLNLRMHDLRHTHASLMLKQGVHPKIVSERLGHATTAFTLDSYSHIVPGLQEAAAKAFDQMVCAHIRLTSPL